MVQSAHLLRFCIVGALGFLIDAGMLWTLMSMGWSAAGARLVSFPSAVVATWALHRAWTFLNAEKTGAGRQLGLYFVLQILGALCNFAVFMMILSVVEETPRSSLAALAVGAVFGLVVNYTGSRLLVFRAPRVPSSAQEQIE